MFHDKQEWWGEIKHSQYFSSPDTALRHTVQLQPGIVALKLTFLHKDKGTGEGRRAWPIKFFFYFIFHLFSFQYLYNTKWQNLQTPSRCVRLKVLFAVCLDMNERMSPSLAGVTCSSLALNTGNWGLAVTNEKDTKNTHNVQTQSGGEWGLSGDKETADWFSLGGGGMVRDTSCSGEGVGQTRLVRWGSCGRVIGRFGGRGRTVVMVSVSRSQDATPITHFLQYWLADNWHGLKTFRTETRHTRLSVPASSTTVSWPR